MFTKILLTITLLTTLNASNFKALSLDKRVINDNIELTIYKFSNNEEPYYDFFVADTRTHTIADGESGVYKLKVMDTPKDFPYVVVAHVLLGSKTTMMSYNLYSKKAPLKIVKIDRVLTNYKKRKYVVNGIYKNANGEYFIDSYTSKGMPVAKCNSCQEYNVESFKVGADGIESIGLKKYEI